MLQYVDNIGWKSDDEIMVLKRLMAMALQMNNKDELIYAKSVVQSCSVQKVFVEISQDSQENTCARVSFLIKLEVWDLQLY